MAQGPGEGESAHIDPGQATTAPANRTNAKPNMVYLTVVPEFFTGAECHRRYPQVTRNSDAGSP